MMESIPLWVVQLAVTLLLSGVTIAISLRSNGGTRRAQEQLRLDTARREYVDGLEKRITRLEQENQLLRASDDRCQEQLAAANERIFTLLSQRVGV
jgi:uncharacterized membrane protein